MTGTLDQCVTVGVGTDGTGPGASAQTTGEIWQCQSSTDDARLNGQLELIYNITGWTDVGAIQWGWARLSNDDGSWSGTWSSTITEAGDQIILGWYVGDGAYEGWSYVETQHGDFQQARDTFGIVYPGAPPPSVTIAPLPDILGDDG